MPFPFALPEFEATSLPAAFGALAFSCPVPGVVDGVPLALPGVIEFGFKVPPGAMANLPSASPFGIFASGPLGNGIGLRESIGSFDLPCIAYGD